MKKLLILFAILFKLYFSSAQAYQPFLVDSAHWIVQEQCCVGICDPENFSNGDYHYTNTIYLKLDGDTIIQGSTYRKLMQNNTISCYMCPNNGVTGPFQPGFYSCNTAALIWEDTVAEKVYAKWLNSSSIYFDNVICQDSLLFDFSRTAGDSMNWAISCYGDSFFVDSIDNATLTFNLTASNVQEYTVKTWYLSQQVNWDGFQLYESIGSSVGFWGGSEAGFNEGQYDSYLVDYCIGSDSACGFSCINPFLGITNLSLQDMSISVYPNPARDILTLDMRNMSPGDNLQFVVTDILGQGISTQTISGARTDIDISGFASGIYLWHLLSEGNIVRSGKVVHD